MLKALGLRTSRPGDPELASPSVALKALEEVESLEHALKAMDLVMDDRPAEATAILDGGDSTYYKLARGVVSFLEATLGFEPDVIQRAVETLHESEVLSLKNRQQALKSGVRTSLSYPAGTEYSLTLAESHLMTAVSLLLSESMLDTAKALLKLRKAYQLLDEVSRQVHGGRRDSNVSNLSSKSSRASVANSISSATTLSVPTQLSAEQRTEMLQRIRDAKAMRLGRVPEAAPNSEIGKDVDGLDGGFETVDEFIKSGIDAMFGLLQLILSIIPSGIGRVLSIVGFKGDKNKGLQMLWSASRYQNIHGALAVLALLIFYDGPTQKSEIEQDPADKVILGDESDYEKLKAAEAEAQARLTTIRTVELLKMEDEIELVRSKLEQRLDLKTRFFPKGALWKHQQARMVSAKGRLEEAVDRMSDPSMFPIEMRQVEGLMLFDKNILLVQLHRFEEAAENFVRLIDINTWSQSLYMYYSAACYTEVYRTFKLEGNVQEAAKAKAIAQDRFSKVDKYFGKKGLMAKTMPFDFFVKRKLEQLNAAARAHKVDLVDAAQTSPVLELIYFWNGLNKMPRAQLQQSLKALGYSGAKGSPYATGTAESEHPDEQLTRFLFTSVILKNLGRYQEAADLLDKHVLPHIWTEIKGQLPSGLPKVTYVKTHRDPWLGPLVIYERGMIAWRLQGEQHSHQQVLEVLDYMKLANGWADDYELSTRVNLKVRSAMGKLETM